MGGENGKKRMGQENSEKGMYGRPVKGEKKKKGGGKGVKGKGRKRKTHSSCAFATAVNNNLFLNNPVL